MDLPVSDALPVPRFPDRQHAVFLATGNGKDGTKLTGVVVREGERAPRPWGVPLSSRVTRSACLFGATGAISLLFASEEGRTTGFILLDVDETGKVTKDERVVRATPNEVLALTADMREGAPPAFLVLEADREKHDHLALVRLLLTGKSEVMNLTPMPGWPVTGEREERKPLRAAEVFLDVGPDGSAWAAMVDDQGNLYGGRLDRSLMLVREAKRAKGLFPHVAALRRSLTISCFTADGMIFPPLAHGAR